MLIQQSTERLERYCYYVDLVFDEVNFNMYILIKF